MSHKSRRIHEGQSIPSSAGAAYPTVSLGGIVVVLVLAMLTLALLSYAGLSMGDVLALVQ